MDELAVYHKLDEYEALASRRGVRDSEGVASQVLVRLWTMLRQGRDVTPGLERLVVNGYIVDALRRESHTTPLRAGEAESDRVPAPAVIDVDGALFSSSLVAALRALPRTQAVAWALVNLNGLTQAEAAEYMGVSREWVNRLVEAARSTLTEQVVV